MGECPLGSFVPNVITQYSSVVQCTLNSSENKTSIEFCFVWVHSSVSVRRQSGPQDVSQGFRTLPIWEGVGLWLLGVISSRFTPGTSFPSWTNRITSAKESCVVSVSAQDSAVCLSPTPGRESRSELWSCCSSSVWFTWGESEVHCL